MLKLNSAIKRGAVVAAPPHQNESDFAMNKSDIPPNIKSRQLAKDGGYKYFHGNPCRKGHDGLRYAYGHCVQCMLDKLSTEEAKEKKKQYRASDAGKAVTKAYNEKHYKENYEYNLKRVAEWQKKNPDKVRALRAKHQPKRNEQTKEWRKSNRHICRIHEEKRRALLAGNGGEHTHEQAMAVLEKQKHRCINCPEKLTESNRHKDHIMPLALGGTNDITNIQWLCKRCNLTKHKKDPIAWAQKNGRLL